MFHRGICSSLSHATVSNNEGCRGKCFFIIFIFSVKGQMIKDFCKISIFDIDYQSENTKNIKVFYSSKSEFLYFFFRTKLFKWIGTEITSDWRSNYTWTYRNIYDYQMQQWDWPFKNTHQIQTTWLLQLGYQ